jgi:DNA uptake protein ComE-like DNA-binding protein
METDLNKASLEELQRRAVPNVVARAIVAEREQVRAQAAWSVEITIS